MNLINGKSGRRSMALVVTLVLVTLISGLVVAFVTRARLDLAASSSFAAMPQADGIGRGAVEFVVGWLRREVQLGSQGYDDSGNQANDESAVLFKPLADANFLPQRTVERQGGEFYQSLVKMSQRGKEFFSSGDGWEFDGNSGLDVASDVSTLAGSANGRRFGPSRWLAPGLMTADEAPTFDDATAAEGNVPDWVYVSRRGPERVTAVTDSRKKDDDPENQDFVLGRFAYTVYDVSGLLDISVAGYPDELDQYSLMAKGNLAWADPSAMSLPGDAHVDRQALVDWRNKATGADFMGYVTNAAKQGFMTNASGDNGFFGRGDLVSFARSAKGQEVLGDTNALPYLTVFSREKAAPSWWPRIADRLKGKCTEKYEKDSFDKNSTNRWAAAVTVEQEFTAPDGTEFRVGDPLLKRRFALSRINMLKPNSGAKADDIWYYFGLVKRGDAGQGSGVAEWVYNPDGAQPTEQKRIIYTLDKIARLGREPNFFELINEGVLWGSTAKSGFYEGMDLRLGRDRSAYHQILQIGANIIDQYDTDADPTIIRSMSDEAIKQGYIQSVNLLASTIRGIENLPYIDEFLTTFMRDRSKGVPKGGEAWINAPISGPPNWGDNKDNKTPFVTYFLQFELWNPHRNARDTKPTQCRLVARQGNTYLDYRAYLPGNNRNTGGGSPDIREYDPENGTGQMVTYNDLFQQQVRSQFPPQRYGRNFASSPAFFEFNAGQNRAYFDEPKLLKYDDPDLKVRVANPLDTFTQLQASITGLRLGDALVVKNLDLDGNANNDFEWFAWDTTIMRWVHRDNHIYPYFQGNQPVIVELQKQSEGGKGWFTYQVFVPKKSGTQLAGVPAFDHSAYCWAYVPLQANLYGRRWPVGHSFNPVSDPRCQRYGFTHGGGISTGSYDYEKAVGATLRDFPRRDFHLNPTQWSGSPGDGASTKLDYLRYGANNPGWQFPAWIAPYSANPNDKCWVSSDLNIEIDQNDLWFWYKWVAGVGTMYYQTAVSEFCENNDGDAEMGGGKSMMYSRDHDGVARRGDGWRGEGTNPYSMRMDAEDNVGRPVFLNRPFQSVGELGYVLRDDPWKTLNLFWADSADSGLLDLFCLEEGDTYRPVRAGVVNPNTAPKEVLSALLAGTALYSKVPGKNTERLDASSAEAIADGIREYLGPTSNPDHVIRNISDVAEMCEKVFDKGGPRGALGNMKYTDVGREVVARALTDVCNTRTWNLFIDVVAQAGRFTAASREPKDFLVKGERRFWVHLAMDRLTGEVLDVDIEPIFE